MKPRTEGCRADSYFLTFSGTNLGLKNGFKIPLKCKEFCFIVITFVVFQFGPMNIK